MTSQKLRRMQTALVGLVVTAVGFALLDVTIFEQLRAADAGRTVELASKSLIMAPGVAASGIGILVLSLTPRFWKRDLFENILPLMLGVAGVAAAFGSGFFLRLWLKAQLRAHGYDFP
jgi:predicted cobalt transporter CbtA